MDYDAKNLNNAVHAKNHEYEDKMKDASGTAQVSKLKAALKILKEEMKEHTLNEGVMNNLLFSCAGMKRG